MNQFYPNFKKRTQKFVGQKYDDTFVKELTAEFPDAHICKPNMMVTMVVSPHRIQLSMDKAGVITSLSNS